ncbi:MAG: hypothetical protein GY832_23520 [Chloroflexi bacterium]|nr:hypothetical protein [Chloroflexota bacterium]
MRNEIQPNGLTDEDILARGVIRHLLAGHDPDGTKPSDCGKWAKVVGLLLDAHAESGTPGVRAVWGAISKNTPELIRLVSTDDNSPLAGAAAEVRKILTAGCNGQPPRLPPFEHAQNLGQLAEFVHWLQVISGAKDHKVKARDRKRGTAHVIRRLLSAQGRLILDVTEGELTGTPYVIGDDSAIWPLVGDLLPVRAMLGQAGLNFSEPAFKWLVDELETEAYTHGPRVNLAHFWNRRGAALYISNGPTRMVKAILDGGKARLEIHKNGKDDIYFASDAVLPEWEIGASLQPSSIGALCPVIKTPPEVNNYTVDVQKLLLDAWLVALVANVRPLPILAAIGDKGGGKTHLIRAVNMLATLDDPNTVSADARDLWTSAIRRPVMALDNVDSTQADWLPDLLAAAVTGVVYERRKLYTDGRLTRSKVRTAFAVSTRTADFARPDVAERTLPIITGVFQDAQRASDADLIQEVKEKRGAVLTWLTRRAVHLIDRLPHAPTLPGRFVDFGRVVWVHSPENAPQALFALQGAQSLMVGDADPLISSIVEHFDALAGGRDYWTGNTQSLTQSLVVQGAKLPFFGSGKVITRMLREGKDTLELFGLSVKIEKPDGRHIEITISKQ